MAAGTGRRDPGRGMTGSTPAVETLGDAPFVSLTTFRRTAE